MQSIQLIIIRLFKTIYHIFFTQLVIKKYMDHFDVSGKTRDMKCFNMLKTSYLYFVANFFLGVPYIYAL